MTIINQWKCKIYSKLHFATLKFVWHRVPFVQSTLFQRFLSQLTQSKYWTYTTVSRVSRPVWPDGMVIFQYLAISKQHKFGKLCPRHKNGQSRIKNIKINFAKGLNASSKLLKFDKSGRTVRAKWGFFYLSSLRLFGAKMCKLSIIMWPDLAKFRHFSTMLKSLCHFEWTYFVFGKILSLLWQILNAHWANYLFWKWPNLKQII